MQARIICENPASKIVQRSREFDACKPSSRDYESQNRLTQGGIRLPIRPLEHLDHVIANADGVQQSLEAERESFQIGHAEVVRHGAKRENKVVIGNLLATVFTRTSRIWRQAYAVRRKIYSGDPCTDEPGAVQAAAQGRGDVAGLKAAARDLGKHRSEEERVCVADQRGGR